MSDFKYPKAEKLKKDTEITLLFAKGKWRSCGNLRIIILKNHPDLQNENVKLGVSVSKRYFKKAVYRNRVKRLLRECYRLNKDLFKASFGDKTIAMMFWVSNELPKKFQDVEAEFIKLCQSQKKS
ncbi:MULTISPECIES: ribonuclease P protein component [Chryseobacterium]|jgi:ribonuclease P protein component|uniref:Ribonuclease P protein component n=1 Tax=Chryseobacterium balustinum TaxID=246 RepID=A0AAX2II80_9FLAO|nr:MULTISPECIES: ribonuclease P protein component [Chryseobacterium]AZB31481.1 ribonuclease P protein component [Chryseobacterium balustinum]MDY0929947.1 ribonuclease P protein component [Chryseobacterium sp. CFBP8996]SKB34287.1 ribonuclease P protein component [Chryseobacterium balustinum]SQA88224.1 ribonuclease P [Chryseobacterium balustinum]